MEYNEILEFSHIYQSSTSERIGSASFFERNLKMIDSHMPLIIAEMIKAYYLGEGKTVKELTEYVKKNNPLKLDLPENFYEYKIQELLMAAVFGNAAIKKMVR